MITVALSNRTKIGICTAFAILMIAAAMYAGERFRPFKIAGDISSYAASQIATADTHANVHVKKPTATNGKYVVKKGDTVWNISEKFGVHTELLKFTNHLGSSSKIKIGQKLIIPQKS